MKVVSETSSRLELSHKSGPLMFGIGLWSAGMAYWTWLHHTGWKMWLGAGLAGVIGAVLMLGACNSRVVFDKSSGWLHTTHRYLFGRRRRDVPLQEISAIAVNVDKGPQSFLSVICVRLDDVDLPLTMFGTPFPPAAQRYGALIARFLGLPLVERERSEIAEPDDALKDVLGEGVSATVFDPLERYVGRPRVTVRLDCAKCGYVESIDAATLVAHQSTRGFTTRLHEATGGTEIQCRRCGTSFVVPAGITP